MMLFAARNIQFVAFQQIIGLFLFANACSYAVYPVLNRAGISTSYTTVGKLLRRLTRSTQEEAHAIAKTRAFLLIYDNINRMLVRRTRSLSRKFVGHTTKVIVPFRAIDAR